LFPSNFKFYPLFKITENCSVFFFQKQNNFWKYF